jgi:hypothetical protein
MVAAGSTSSSSLIEEPNRQELVAAWHRGSPEVTYGQADASFNGWRLSASIWLRENKAEKGAI